MRTHQTERYYSSKHDLLKEFPLWCGHDTRQLSNGITEGSHSKKVPYQLQIRGPRATPRSPE